MLGNERQEIAPNLENKSKGLRKLFKYPLPLVKTMRDFIKVSPMQQLISLASSLELVFLGHKVLESLDKAKYMEGTFRGSAIDVLALGGGSAVVFSAIVNERFAIVKLSEYRQMKNALSKFGWDERLIEPRSHSWCQRHATRMAAIDCGFKNEIDEYFTKGGHRWWHFEG